MEIPFYQRLLKRIGKKLDKIIKVYQPTSLKILVFDIIVFWYLVVQIWKVLLHLSFEEDVFPNIIFPYFYEIGIIIISLKALLSLNTAIYV